jgi:hypothetical protein
MMVEKAWVRRTELLSLLLLLLELTHLGRLLHLRGPDHHLLQVGVGLWCRARVTHLLNPLFRRIRRRSVVLRDRNG